MNIAIFGGGFSPPTLGHLHVAKSVLDTCDIDYVDILPSYHHRFKSGMIDFEHRMRMCELNFDDLGMKTVEIEKLAYEAGSDGSTRFLAEFVSELSKSSDSIYRDCQFSFVIGVDNADTIATWKDPEWLLSNVNFIVIPRGGYSPKLDWYRKENHTFLDVEAVEFSSTQAREGFRNGDFSMMKDEVVDYMHKYNVDI
jgi:nicotinate-nucleotide adenylyltransferase